MSTSLLSPPTLRPATTRRAIRRKHPRSMAICFDNCRANSAINPVHLDYPLHKYIELSCAGFPDLILRSDCTAPSVTDPVWAQIQEEARSDVDDEPILRMYYFDVILSQNSLESALACHLASKLCVPDLVTGASLRELFHGVLTDDPAIGRAARADLRAARDRDPACSKMAHCFLYYKGFLACQAHRVAHRLWASGRRAAALLIQSRVSEAFAVDIHPGARIGSGELLDHATGVVIGETAVVEDYVTPGGRSTVDIHPGTRIGSGELLDHATGVVIGETAVVENDVSILHGVTRRGKIKID